MVSLSARKLNTISQNLQIYFGVMLIFIISSTCNIVRAGDWEYPVQSPRLQIKPGIISTDELYAVKIDINKDTLHAEYAFKFADKRNFERKQLFVFDLLPYKWGWDVDNYPDRSFSGLNIKINNEKIKYNINSKAFFGDYDITDELLGAGINPNIVGSDERFIEINEQAKEKYKNFIDKEYMGIVHDDDTWFTAFWVSKLSYWFTYSTSTSTPLNFEYSHKILWGYELFTPDLFFRKPSESELELSRHHINTYLFLKNSLKLEQKIMIEVLSKLGIKNANVSYEHNKKDYFYIEQTKIPLANIATQTGLDSFILNITLPLEKFKQVVFLRLDAEHIYHSWDGKINVELKDYYPREDPLVVIFSYVP